METTTIEISFDNWRWLNAQKHPGDSFDDVLDRLRADLEDERDGPTTDADDA